MRSRVEGIAARLSRALKTPVRRAEGPNGIRLEADLPPDLTETERKVTLAAISDADSFGHERTRRGDLVWAFINSEDVS
ncbi:hypothetical protein ABT040_29010 [Streptomyces sp. NPDC002688]|uniref:hypothetical protein n=1 Tax=Streptomyces sp. NPDC002688 TaxID=3154423 RepID=UPI003316EC80